MKDFQGTETKEGDLVLQTGCFSKHLIRLRVRKVLKVTEDSVTLEALERGPNPDWRYGTPKRQREFSNRNSVCKTPDFLYVYKKETL